MILSVKERLILLNVLPTQESYANMLVIRDLLAEIGFSEADHKQLGLVEEGGNVTWQDDKEIDKDVSIGTVAYGLIRKAFKKLDADSGITIDLMPVYQRFVEDEVEVETVEEASA